MRYSIRRQMTIVFIGLLAFILGAIFIVNAVFLERYYISNKTDDLVETYQFLNDTIGGQELDEDTSEYSTVLREMGAMTERMNLDILIIDRNGNPVLGTIKNEDPRFFSTFRSVYYGDENSTVIESNEDYEISRTADTKSSTTYLRIKGVFSNGYAFMVQSPLASIRESAAIANQFLIYLGVFGMVFGGILVWLFSRRISKPIMELTELSEAMANLNFDVKYTSGGKNEIGILGENFNKMALQLEKTISELKSANNQLKKDIEQKEKIEDMRNEFLGNVSHELKTPLALIQGYAEGLKEGVNDDPESREFYCDVIMDEAGKMNRMVRNLLTLNQLEFGSDEVQFERFDIVGLVHGVIASCEILIQQAEAKIDFITDGPVYVWADEFKTEQVVRNYLTNAIHHVENEKRIEVRVLRCGDKARITVFNSGKPIPEEDVPKLWDKFYKVDKAHTREYGGNGIGLSIVKAIMESFHEAYGVKNFDNGVAFWFELDAKTERKELEAQEKLAPEQNNSALAQ